MRITFLGAALEVTGSAHLVETRGVRLLVDCVLFVGDVQDSKKLNAVRTGAKTVRIYGCDFQVRARVHILGRLAAHAPGSNA
jgi:hypothetical protein